MRSGGATRDVATWRMLISGVNPMTLGFPTVFQFFGPKTFISFTFPISLIIYSKFYFILYSLV